MENLLQLATRAVEGKTQWYVGEKVTVAAAGSRQAYVRNDDCFLRLYTSDDHNRGLTVGWLDLAEGVWKIAQDAAANYAAWAAKKRKEEMKGEDKLLDLAQRALEKYPQLTTRPQAAAELVRRGHVHPRGSGRFEVQSQGSDVVYDVDVEARSCTCYDAQHNAPKVCGGPMCKHRLAALMYLKIAETAPDPGRIAREQKRVEVRAAAARAGVPVLI